MSADTSPDPAARAEDALGLAAWTAVLDSLEVALDDVIGVGAPEDVIERAATLTGWTPPTIGPLPDALLERAQLLSERQRDAVARMTTELGALRRHRSAVSTVQHATASSQTSVYMDVTG